MTVFIVAGKSALAVGTRASIRFLAAGPSTSRSKIWAATRTGLAWSALDANAVAPFWLGE
ncbi:hypothetical protein [Yinghuangia sp. YIM S09857]|uniref:hypothetical protein n=1 Tax=Yinghuangia sp. YIM S09857 TaxID=3436929 RepID=UPI003F53DE36